MDTRKARRVAAAVAVVVAVSVAAVAGGLWLWSSQTYEESYTSSYEYSLEVRTNGTLKNVTLYLPLPVEDNESEVGGVVVDGNVYEETDLDTEPPPWEYALVETEHGLMLEVGADRIVGRDRLILREFDDEGRLRSMRETTEEKMPENTTNTEVVRRPVRYTRIAGAESNRSIDTRSPLGDEPMLSPKENVSAVDCATVHTGPPTTAASERCYVYGGFVHADYEASPSARVHITAELEGSNSWWVGGWSSNRYTDSVEATLVGEQDGWVVAQGTYTEGAGRYR